MEVFGLVAKLTLNTDEYEKALRDAEREGGNISDPAEPTLGLNDEPFTEGIEEANDAEVEDKDSTLDLDNKPYTDSLDEAEEKSGEFEGSIGEVFGNIKSLIVAAGVVTAVAKITDSLSEAVNLARSMGDNIDKSSRAMSITTDAYQEWSHVLDINGASISDLNRGLMSMRKLMGGGEVTKEAGEAFDKLGLSAKVANGEITSTEDLLKASLKALADFDTSTDTKLAERDYLAQSLFGRGGTKLNALFDGTSKDIDYLINQAHELGLVMSEDEIKNAAAYNDAVTNMEQSLTAFKTAIVQDIIPGLTDVANTVAQIVAFFNPRTRQKSLSEIYADKDKAFAEELSTIEGTADAAESLADKLLKMGDTSKMTADQYAIWKGTAQELISLVPSLGEQIDLETGKINGNSESIRANIQEWENLAKQKALQNLKEAKYQAIVEKNEKLIEKSIEANRKEADATAARAKALKNVNDILTANGYESLNEAATWQDIADAQQRIAMEQPDNYGLLMDISKAAGEWTKATNEYELAKKQVEELTAEIEKAKQDYDEWAGAADAMFGSASETAGTATSDVKKLEQAIRKLPDDKTIRIGVLTGFGENVAMPKAKGDWYVPWDNYPALLHRGEAVLTASQARAYREGSSGIDGAELGRVFAKTVKDTMKKINVMMSGEKVGDLTTKQIEKNMNASSYSRIRAYGG